MPCRHLCGTLLHPQLPKYLVEGAAQCPERTSVALSCTLSGPNTGLRGQHNALHASLWHFPAPSAAEIPGRGGYTMPCTHLCGTSLHPQLPQYRAEGAAQCPARTSVALPCTLSGRNTGLRGRHNVLHASLWHFPAPSAAEIPGRGGSTLPCRHLCGTSLHPQRPKYRVEGAATCPAGTSAALPCTLSCRNNGLLGKK